MSARPFLRYDLMLWLFTGSLACLLALYPISAALVGATYLPADADSFYHAHRILDSISAPERMYQFDPRIHAPEGSWITWPWAYDMSMAWIAHVAVYAFGITQPLAVLAYVAPIWSFGNAALILGIANRLGLMFPLKIVAMLCYACSPLTQSLHRVGMLDHHFVEYSFVLATVLLGLRWFQAIENTRYAAVLGAILGMAPAFHNGLFILQLPVLVTLIARWLLGHTRTPTQVAVFSASLLASTFVWLLPSEPFRIGMFAFELQSWFHLYIAGSTSLIACLLAVSTISRRSIVLLLAVASILFALIYSQTMHARSFLSGDLAGLTAIGEVKGVFGYLADGNFYFLNSHYSALLWLMPATLALLCWRVARKSNDANLFFAIVSLSGMTLLLLQYRFENYGSFVLYFPLCLLVQEACARRPLFVKRLIAGIAVGVTAAYVPAFAQLTGKPPIGANNDYEMTRAIYPPLAEACARHPGTVLADSSDGHYITYHTQCGVIADNFIMTLQHERKLLEVDKLMRSSLQVMLKEAPEVQYIFVRRRDNVFASNCAQAACAINQGLRQDLLFSSSPFPTQLHLIAEVRILRDQNHTEPLARAFEIVRRSN